MNWFRTFLRALDPSKRNNLWEPPGAPQVERYAAMASVTNTNIWTSSTDGTELTASDLVSDYGTIQTRPEQVYQSTVIDGHCYTSVSMDEASEIITEPEPPCEDLGEFLLRKYNGTETRSIAGAQAERVHEVETDEKKEEVCMGPVRYEQG